MELADLIALCQRERLDLSSDSRTVKPGGIFVACSGARENGADYIAQAIASGASYIVSDRQCALGQDNLAGSAQAVHVDDPRQALWQLAKARWSHAGAPAQIVAVTGTNGKTTTAALLEHIFVSLGASTGVLGTIEYRWPGRTIPAPLTTPDPVSLHEMLAQMAESGVDAAVMEVSSHALDQLRVDGVPFTGAVFTNLTQDHLDYHGDMESYFRAKARLFTDAPNAPDRCAINCDDPYGRRLLELKPALASYGLHPAPGRARHLLGEILGHGVGGLRLKMSWGGKSWELESPLVGRFNAYNLLAAQSFALELGLPQESMAALAGFNGVRGRLERIPNPHGLHIFVDYAHTPDALVNALDALRGAGFRRIITVFGCGGNRDRAKRPLMGQAVAASSDVAILTSDNPRYEDPLAIMRDVEPGLANARETYLEPDRRKATELGLELCGRDDALLIAGKGHEDYQIVGGKKHHYSDQEVVRELTGCA